MNKLQQPIDPKIIIRLLIVLVLILAFLSGYFHALYQTEVRKGANCYNIEST